MTTPGDFRGSRLLDFKVKATREGYLDIFVLTDKGAFELLHDSIEVHEGGTGGFESRIPSEYKGAEVKDLWTDGESLFIELQDERFVVYEFALAQSGGSAESLRFASKPDDLKPILDYLGDPDMRKLLV